MQMGKLLTKGLLFSSFIAILGCSSGPIGYNRTSIPNVPYLNLDVHKQAKQLTTTDRVCIFNGGDMITDSGTRYKNSGRFMQKIFVRTMQQYNIDGAFDMGATWIDKIGQYEMQEQARQHYCNIIAISKPVFWHDSQLTPGNIGLNVDMYDTSSLDLLNSVTLNARSDTHREMFLPNTPLKPVIEKYVDTLYQ